VGCEYNFPEKAEIEIMDEVIVGSALMSKTQIFQLRFFIYVCYEKKENTNTSRKIQLMSI
jgi:hypothetical protein